MWVRGKDKNTAGKFEFSLYEGRALVKTVGGFDTAQEADRAAELAQRMSLFGLEQAVECNMSDDELLAELGA